jgi:hypothetical protein
MRRVTPRWKAPASPARLTRPGRRGLALGAAAAALLAAPGHVAASVVALAERDLLGGEGGPGLRAGEAVWAQHDGRLGLRVEGR